MSIKQSTTQPNTNIHFNNQTKTQTSKQTHQTKQIYEGHTSKQANKPPINRTIDQTNTNTENQQTKKQSNKQAIKHTNERKQQNINKDKQKLN